MGRNLSYIRLYSFASIGAGAFIFPFLNLFYQERGLSGSQIGMLVAAGGMAALLAAPAWGRWSDASRYPVRLLQLALLGSGVCMFLLGKQTTFLWMAFFVTCNALVGGGLEPLSTTQAVAITNQEKAGYGSVRLWGSLGWAVIAPISGWLIERSGFFTPFIGFLGGMLVSAAILFLIVPKRPEDQLRSDSQPQSAAPSGRLSVMRLIAELARNRTMAGLALALTILWISTAGRVQFEAIYMKELGASETVIGLASTLAALIELPGMLIADQLVRRFGAGSVLRGSLLMQVGGMLLVLIFPSVAAILALRALSGFIYSFYLVSSIAYMVQGAPERQASTVLALYMVTLSGLVGLVGAPLAGVLYDAHGAYWLYAFALAGSVLSWLVLRATARPKPSLAAV
jgi:MFS transporter, PPP family, 3-phenylpropionic acid transporter